MPYKDSEKQKEATRIRQERKRDEFRALKESNPCADCGNYYPYWIMQYDHREADKKSFQISQRSASFGSAKFFEEIKKCDLVCANCHSTRTYKRKNGNVAQE